MNKSTLILGLTWPNVTEHARFSLGGQDKRRGPVDAWILGKNLRFARGRGGRGRDSHCLDPEYLPMGVQSVQGRPRDHIIYVACAGGECTLPVGRSAGLTTCYAGCVERLDWQGVG